MAHLGYESNSFALNANQYQYLVKMSSSSNLYSHLTHNFDKNDDDISDNDVSLEANTITMTSSTSSDSAIASDDIDDSDLTNDKQKKYYNAWPKTLKQSESANITFSPSFDILNEYEQQTIYDNDISNSIYRQPLPWTKSSYYHTPSNKV